MEEFIIQSFDNELDGFIPSWTFCSFDPLY